MLLPARSPRHALGFGNNIPLSGGIFFELVSLIQNYGSVVGAAFPSSHVAVAWIALLSLRHNYRYLFWSLVPLVITLMVAVVILQYHYVVDAIGGILIAIFVERFRKQLAALNSEKNAAKMLQLLTSETAQAPVT
jgi:membrane-associated phospholipid phosphatase